MFGIFENKGLSKNDHLRAAIAGDNEVDLVNKPSLVKVAMDAGNKDLALKLMEKGHRLKRSEITEYTKENEVKPNFIQRMWKRINKPKAHVDHKGVEWTDDVVGYTVPYTALKKDNNPEIRAPNPMLLKQYDVDLQKDIIEAKTTPRVNRNDGRVL